MASDPIEISVWGDDICPFCYLVLPYLDFLREEFGNEVKIGWRAFELRPDPLPTLDPGSDYLHRVWEQSVYPMAESPGMELRAPRFFPVFVSGQRRVWRDAGGKPLAVGLVRSDVRGATPFALGFSCLAT